MKRLRLSKSWESGDIYEVGTGRYVAAICRTWSTDPASTLDDKEARQIASRQCGCGTLISQRA